MQYIVVWILSPSEWKVGIWFLEWAFTTGRPKICLWFCFNCIYLPFLDFCARFCWLSQKWELWWEERNYRRKTVWEEIDYRRKTVREENAGWYLREKRLKGKRSLKASRQFLSWVNYLFFLFFLSSALPSKETKTLAQKLGYLDSPSNYCETLCYMTKPYSQNCLIKTNCIVVFKDKYLKKMKIIVSDLTSERAIIK